MIKTSLFAAFLLVAVNVVAADTKKNSDANATAGGEKSYDYVLSTRTASGKLSTRVSVDEIKTPFKQQDDSYLDTVVYYDILTNSNIPSSSTAKAVAFVADNEGVYAKKLEEEAKKLREKKEKKAPSKWRATGFCVFKNDVAVTASNEFSLLDCSFKTYGEDRVVKYESAKLFVGLYPNYRRETLVALPIYVKSEDGKEYPATGVLLNAKLTSVNVATKVDNVRIRKLLAKSLLVTSDVAYEQATRYLAAVERSKVRQDVIYDTQTQNGVVTNVPVVITNVDKPDKKDYWAVGAVDLAASLVDLFGRDYLEYLTPLFEVKKGTVVYADVVYTDAFDVMEQKFNEIGKRIIEASDKENKKWNEEKTTIRAKAKVIRRTSGTANAATAR